MAIMMAMTLHLMELNRKWEKKLMNELNNEELNLKFSPTLNLAYLNDDGTVTIESAGDSETFNQGVNYVYCETKFYGNSLATTIKHVPFKLTVGTVRKGHDVKLLREMSQAAYKTISKADNMGLLNGREVEYFDLEQKVFANQKEIDKNV